MIIKSSKRNDKGLHFPPYPILSERIGSYNRITAKL
jgi:hypothetical protein